jgi:hypothetical protein
MDEDDADDYFAFDSSTDQTTTTNRWMGISMDRLVSLAPILLVSIVLIVLVCGIGLVCWNCVNRLCLRGNGYSGEDKCSPQSDLSSNSSHTYEYYEYEDEFDDREQGTSRSRQRRDQFDSSFDTDMDSRMSQARHPVSSNDSDLGSVSSWRRGRVIGLQGSTDAMVGTTNYRNAQHSTRQPFTSWNPRMLPRQPLPQTKFDLESKAAIMVKKRDFNKRTRAKAKVLVDKNANIDNDDDDVIVGLLQPHLRDKKTSHKTLQVSELDRVNTSEDLHVRFQETVTTMHDGEDIPAVKKNICEIVSTLLIDPSSSSSDDDASELASVDSDDDDNDDEWSSNNDNDGDDEEDEDTTADSWTHSDDDYDDSIECTVNNLSMLTPRLRGEDITLQSPDNTPKMTNMKTPHDDDEDRDDAERGRDGESGRSVSSSSQDEFAWLEQSFYNGFRHRLTITTSNSNHPQSADAMDESMLLQQQQVDKELLSADDEDVVTEQIEVISAIHSHFEPSDTRTEEPSAAAVAGSDQWFM